MGNETTATPAPTPTAPTTSTSPTAPLNTEGGEQPSFDFAALAAHDENDDAPAVPDSGEGAPPSGTPAAPASPSPGQLPAPSAPLVPPVAAAAPPTPPAEPAAGQPPPQAPETPAPGAPPELTIEQHREKFLPQLAKLYQLSDAEVESLRVDPGKALPELASKLHYEVQMATYQGIVSVLPQLISQAIKGHETSSTHEGQFFAKWPALKDAISKDPKVQEVIVNAISSFKQLNPKASLEDTIARAGLLAMMTLKLPLDLQPPAATNGAAGAPQAVVPQASTAPARPPGVGATGHVPNAPAPGAGDEANIFAEIAEGHMRGDF